MAPSASALTPSLLSLLPSYTAQTLPPSLVHLSESLLAQSRQRASHLKQDEEIARAYACCEIACLRLRAKLRLPAPKSGGAPCKPASYKRLVGFLSGVLSEDVTGTPKSTPGGKKRTRDGMVKNGTLVEEHDEPSTPSKSTRGNTFLGKVKIGAQKNTEDAGQEAPSYVMPSIRKLCKTFSTPLLAPHVYTGVCVALKLDGLWPPGEDSEEDTLKDSVIGILIGLYLMTLTVMQKAAKMKKTVYQETCAKAVEVLDFIKGVKGVEVSIRRINQQGYASGQDWFAGVPKRVFEFDPDAIGEADGDSEEGEEANPAGDGDDEDEDDVILSSRRRRKAAKSIDEDDPEGILLPGLHTMMQDSFDLLSDERTRAFEKWKKQFLQKLDRLDKSAKPRAVKARKAVAVN
ncbi:hypothetical protein H2200_003069 [Cladophialophora chaetospira]|uniref:ORC6 first cyclin-like domain-containing protein n=1 Tax=Cladophialophora chaetospira TaxID=386627 RepID=A0AA39CME0_9EURO|nr:hypothetical protein H2200_003069 [Cladophialophora chaetospira]